MVKILLLSVIVLSIASFGYCADLNIGDVVVTSGLEEGMPRGLLIGTVEAVEKEAHQPFQTAVIKPFISFSKITLASILISTE